jgi:hypothetical protein
MEPVGGVDSWMMKASLGPPAHGRLLPRAHTPAHACRLSSFQPTNFATFLFFGRQHVISLLSILCYFMASPVERLPVEVFEIVALDLDLWAYQQLRLSSRQLHSLSLSTFAKRYFSELTTTLGSPSLDRLANICNHGYFCNIVTLLNIKLLNHRDYKLLTSICKVGIFPPPKRFSTVPGIRTANISGEATLYNDILHGNHQQSITDRLTRSLQRLSNIKTIRLRAFHSEPVGWRMIEIPKGDALFRTKCFQAVLDSIIKSEIKLEEFSMAKSKKANTIRKCADVPYPALQFSFPVLSSLQNSFLHLQSLTLALVAAHNGNSRVPGWENGVSQLVSCAPNLKKLALSLDRNRQISQYSAPIVHSLASSCHLLSLESFQLVNCSLHEADLDRFVTTHAGSLRMLIINDVRHVSGSWVSFWTSLKEVKQLRCLRLGSLEATNSAVTLHWRNKLRLKFTLDEETSGRPMCDMLDELIAAYNKDMNFPPSIVDLAG